MQLYGKLNEQNAFIWRIVHKRNIPWILDNGLHCQNSSVQDPGYVSIGNVELIERRARKTVPIAPGGAFGDYIPFYFTPFSIMMYNIHTGYGGIEKRPNEEICLLVSQLRELPRLGVDFVFTDRHAYTATARFFNDLADLGEIDWPLLQRRDFKADPQDPEKQGRYQAEALAHRRMPINALVGVVCHNGDVASELSALCAERGLDIQVHAIPAWYF